LVLAIALRRARKEANVKRIRDVLEIALQHDLLEGPTPRQAAALLVRSQKARRSEAH
jgi:hypothetical protein